MTGRSGSKTLLLLLLLAFTVDLLTPFLIWKGVLPSAVRWLSDLAVAGMLVLAFAHMLTLDHIPKLALLIVGFSMIGITVALFEGQSMIATTWGWWLFFRFLIVGLFAYLHPIWPNHFARRLVQLCMVVLGLEVVIQLGQYIIGEIPGDNLSGSFGQHGVAPLIMFILFVLCLALGQWLTDGKWHLLVWVLVLGGVSSTLGEIKLFPIAVVVLGGIALIIQMIRGRQLHKLLMYLVLFGTIIIIFTGVYNSVVAEERGTRRLEEYLELQTLDQYLNFSINRGGGRYEFGRGFALNLGWKSIQRDITTFLFGMGFGARAESVALGIAGEGLQQGYYGLNSGTSLLVLMQELGLIGLAVLVGINLWIIFTLARDTKMDPGSDITVLRYALILYSICWPLWLWYSKIWNIGVVMLLYWATLGFALSQSPARVIALLPSEDRQGESILLSGD